MPYRHVRIIKHTADQCADDECTYRIKRCQLSHLGLARDSQKGQNTDHTRDEFHGNRHVWLYQFDHFPLFFRYLIELSEYKAAKLRFSPKTCKQYNKKPLRFHLREIKTATQRSQKTIAPHPAFSAHVLH